MLPKVVSLAVASVLATGVLTIAQPALAADRCVFPHDSCANDYMDIQTALDDAATSPGLDRILLGAATYPAPAQGFIYDPMNSDDPVEIVGASQTDTILTGPTGGIRTLAVFGGSGTTVRDMRIVMPPDAVSGAQALRTNGLATRVSVVDDVAEKNDRTGVMLLGDGVLDDVFIGLALDQSTTGVKLAGGGTIGNHTGIDASLPVESGGGVIDRATLLGRGAGIEVKHGSTKIKSTRISTNGFGSVGIAALSLDGDATVEVDGVTIRGPNNPSSGTGMDVGNPYMPSATVDVVVKNTIIRGYPNSFWVGGTAPGHAHVAASYSDYDSSTKTVNSGASTEFTESNVSFVGETGFDDEGDYTLMPGSPLVDAGDPGTAQGLDVYGHALVTDGDGDGVARRDIGASERPAVPLKPADQVPPTDGGQPAGQPAGPGAVVPSRDTLAPAISGLRVSRKVFTVGRARTAIAARSARGTRISYKLSENAKVVISIRRVGAKRAAGRLTRTAKAGANTLKFSGRIGAKALKPGRYRAVITATDAAGNRSAARSVGFRIARHA